MALKNKAHALLTDAELRTNGKALLRSAFWPAAGLSLGIGAASRLYQNDNICIPLTIASGFLLGISIRNFNVSCIEFAEKARKLLRTVPEPKSVP